MCMTSNGCRKQAAPAMTAQRDAGLSAEAQRDADLAALPRGASLPDQLAAESAARPRNGLTIEQVVQHAADAGLTLVQSPALGRSYRAVFCGQASAAGALQAVVCEYADESRAARGTNELTAVFTRMPGGSVSQVGPSALVLVFVSPDGERVAKQIREKFLKSN
jgi:hypothetical protein